MSRSSRAAYSGERSYASPPTTRPWTSWPRVSKLGKRPQEPVLALPRLQASDDPGDDSIGRDTEPFAELHLTRRRPSCPCSTPGIDDEEDRRGQSSACASCLASTSSRSPWPAERRDPVHPVAVGDHVLPPDDPAPPPGQHRRGRPVELRLGAPVQNHVGSDAAQDTGQLPHRSEGRRRLAQPPGRDHLGLDPSSADLTSKGPGPRKTRVGSNCSRSQRSSACQRPSSAPPRRSPHGAMMTTRRGTSARGRGYRPRARAAPPGPSAPSGL